MSIFKIIASRKPRAWLIASLAAVSAVCSSCASTVVSVGDWGRTSDLHLTKESLSGVRVTVLCGYRSAQNDLVEDPNPSCRLISIALQSIGAEIIKPKGDAADLVVWFISRPAGGASNSFIADALSVFTVGLTPMVSTTTSRAELQIVDTRGVVLDRAPLEAQEISLFGWAAVRPMLFGSHDRRSRMREFQASFLRFVQNRVYSQAILGDPVIRLSDGRAN